MFDSEQIAQFWAWFEANESQLRFAYDNKDAKGLDRLINPRVQAVAAGCGWEIGPYSLPDHSFVISPGSKERAHVSRRIVESAPQIAGWRFFAGKPAKDLLSLTFVIEESEVCADNWRYRLTSYNKGEFVDVDIFFESGDAPTSGSESFACELVIESMIGELLSLERVGYVKHHCVKNVVDAENSTPMRFLKPHLDEVLSPVH